MTRLTDERLVELYDGTLQLVAEHGFDKVTMDRIAEATHSSKATLYRQWGSKSALVADALLRSVEDHHQPVDTGRLRSDLHLMLTQDKPRTVEDGALIGALLHAVKHDVELARVLREKVVHAGRQRIDAVVAAAVARGEVSADCPGIEHVALLIIAQVVLQPVIDETPWRDEDKVRYIDDVLLPVLGIHPDPLHRS
jgi:AcrR family transcriptional regulator